MRGSPDNRGKVLLSVLSAVLVAPACTSKKPGAPETAAVRAPLAAGLDISTTVVENEEWISNSPINIPAWKSADCVRLYGSEFLPRKITTKVGESELKRLQVTCAKWDLSDETASSTSYTRTLLNSLGMGTAVTLKPESNDRLATGVEITYHADGEWVTDIGLKTRGVNENGELDSESTVTSGLGVTGGTASLDCPTNYVMSGIGVKTSGDLIYAVRIMCRPTTCVPQTTCTENGCTEDDGCGGEVDCCSDDEVCYSDTCRETIAMDTFTVDDGTVCTGTSCSATASATAFDDSTDYQTVQIVGTFSSSLEVDYVLVRAGYSSTMDGYCAFFDTEYTVYMENLDTGETYYPGECSPDSPCEGDFYGGLDSVQLGSVGTTVTASNMVVYVSLSAYSHAAPVEEPCTVEMNGTLISGIAYVTE